MKHTSFRYNQTRLMLLAGLLVFISCLYSCEKSYFARDIVDSDVPIDQMKLPGLTTRTISLITQNSAQSGGEITSDGGGHVKVSGLCWSTTPTPTIEDSKTKNGPTHGQFSSFVTKLTFNTKYYLRAYATNAKGTAYGAEISFTTTAPLASVTTQPASNLTSTSVQSGGVITALGETVTAKGVCWSAEREPTIADSKTADGVGAASFTSNITGLVEGLTYRIRAYVTNSGGTAYGNTIVVTAPMPTVTDIDGNVYQTLKVGTQIWMKQNLKVKRYRNGDPIADLGAYPQTYINTYGYLYNGHAVVDPRNIAPAGWRVATLDDWKLLISTIGNNAGKIKEAGTANWISTSPAVTNETGFTALPGGLGFGGPAAGDVGSVGIWWTSSYANATDLSRVAVTNDIGEVLLNQNDKSLHFSVRLIKQ